MKARLVIIITLMLLTAGSARAWDGERKGFLLGLGLGIGYDSYSGVQYDEIGPEEEDNSSVAFAASPRIGYACNNRLSFFYSRHPFIFSVKNEENDDVTITTCIESLEVQYYLEERAPSLYLGLGAGIGYFFHDGTSNYSREALKGIGILGTVGYEPIRHLSAEISLHYKSPQEGASDIGVSLLVNVLGY
ncbi:MAG: hypothetical protein KAR44_02285 [Candidatus Aegiribacteria sp.]|nr:hypothetical protein [Candidatus Aegiribacteria sp.]